MIGKIDAKRLDSLKSIDVKEMTGLKPSEVMKTPVKTAYEAAMAVPVGEKNVEELAREMYAANANFWDYNLKLEPRCRPWEKTASWVRDTWLKTAQSRIEKERGTA